MAKKAKQHGWRGKIPFSPRRPPSDWDIQHGRTEDYIGGQLSYGDSWDEKDTQYVKWADNFEFEDTLTFESCHRGRSSATFQFLRSDGSYVNFFMQELTRLFPYFVDGKVTGRFTFIKRGANYSCSIIPPSSDE